MARKDVQRAARRLAKRQHWVIARVQLLALGFTRHELEHRIENGRLHRIWAGVYAVDRPNLTQEGLFVAAVLACGPGAVLSHLSAAILWGLIRARSRVIEVSVPLDRNPRRRGIKVHRRKTIDATRHKNIPVTSPIQTLLDLATVLDPEQYERAVNEAVNRDLIDPEELRAALDALGPQPGIRPLRKLLDRDTYVCTETELEQRLVPIARRAGLPKPEAQAHVNGRRVDFYFRELGIVVEANSLRFHRTPSQQANDARRTQAHIKAGLLPIPFTHQQITYDPRYVDVAPGCRFPPFPFVYRATRLHTDEEEAMKYVMLIYSGGEAWERFSSLSEEEQNAVSGEYFAIAQEPGALGGEQLQPVETATTVRVEDGRTLTTDGPFAETKEALGGFYLFEADDLDRAIEIASRIPAARMGGAIEVRPVVER